MRRSLSRAVLVALAAAALCAPRPASAQVHFLIGGGLSSPSGDFGNAADVGYQGRAGIQIGFPVFPLSFRAEGELDRFSLKAGSGHATIGAGTASAILSLGGVGVSPYVIAGIGTYRTSATATVLGVQVSTHATDVGYHIGLGVKAGFMGFGLFGEARFVDIATSGSHTRYFPITVGLSF
jgi:hypothetical protein